MTNPFFESWDGPFGMPPFDRIRPEHFQPAFERGMAEQGEEIAAIIANPDAADFANTIEALDFSGALLSKVSKVFFNLTSANTSDEIQAIESKMAPLITVHHTKINTNSDLFARIEAVYQNRQQTDLTLEQIKLVEETHKSFVRAGAALNADARQSIAELDEELSRLDTSFGQNVLKDTNDFELILEQADLKGLPHSAIAAAAQEANDRGKDGKYIFTISRSSFTPFLQFAENRDLREKMYRAYTKCSDNNNANDNKALVAKISSLRVRRANLLGFPSHAAYILDDRMAKTPEGALGLLKKLWGPTQEKVQQEADDLQAMIQQEGGNFELTPWDWWYYAEKVREQRYNLDPDEVKPYFELENVRDGAFFAAKKLYGITFERRTDLPLPHPEAQSFEVNDKDGRHLGVFIADYHMRASKRGGAWMSTYRDQSTARGEVRPIVSNNCNFPKAEPGEPVLLGFDEVQTLFHEFGHALHGLLTDVTYKRLSGTSVKRDFVELPSQIMEHWALEPEVMKSYARHIETGAPIPDELITKIRQSRTFNQGFKTTEYLAASFLDFAWCMLESEVERDVDELESKTLEDIGLIAQIEPRYRSTYFQHIFSGGYSAGYYSYIWAEVLDTDGYEAFSENGIFDPATAQSFRDNVLSKGGTEDPMELYKRFRGREPDIAPLLKERGLG
jgi:peptidyl-dipeptidase Dcp